MRVPVPQVFPLRTSLRGLLVHALGAWALSAALLVLLVASFERMVASALFTLGAPALSGLIAARYFRRGTSEEPMAGALGFTAIAAVLDAMLAAGVGGQAELLHPAFGFSLPLLLVFGTTGLIGELVRPGRRPQVR